MYKMQTHKYTKYFVFICMCLCIMFFSSQKCFAVDILEKSLNKIEKNIDKSASKKTVVKDIYKSSLNQFHYDQLTVLSHTVSKVREQANERYFCSLKDKDVINILYYANLSFRRDIDTMTLPSISKPDTNDMKSSCGKFNICVWQVNWQIWDVSTYWCLPKMSSLYADISSNEKSVSTLVDRIQWTEYFWNGTLDDSTYDLLVDVYDVSKILFGEESTVEPPETVFFDMPKLNNANGMYEDTSSSTVVDWFSPYNTTTTNSTSNQGWNPNAGSTLHNWLGLSNQWATSATNNIWSMSNNLQSNLSAEVVSQDDSENQGSTPINNNLNEWLDDDISNFIQTVNTLSVESQNVTTVSLWNQCVSGFSYQYKTGYTITDTWVILAPGLVEPEDEVPQQPVEEYLADVLQQIHALQCNNDFVCDSWESTTCPDCMPMASWTTVVAEVENLINSLELGSWEEITQQTVGCINHCKQTQTSIEALLLCVAKCFCTTYESRQFNPTEFPWLSPIFKLKFCVIPATQVQKDNTKIARSIQTVFDVMYDLVTDLKYGWWTMPAVKTKTYLDSSYMKNSFAKNISFLITSNSKKHVSQVSKKAKDENQEKVNTSLSKDIVWFATDPADFDEKNKYVVAQESYQWKSEEILNLWDQIHESLGNDIVITADARFNQFLQLNANFWKEVKEILQEFNTQSDILKKKK